MTDDEMDAIVKRAHACAVDNGYEEEMRGWTSYEYAVDLGDTEPDLEGQDVFAIEASVKRVIYADYGADLMEHGCGHPDDDHTYSHVQAAVWCGTCGKWCDHLPEDAVQDPEAVV